MIRVLVSGSGKMGRAILDALDAADGIEPVGVVDKFATSASIALPSGRELSLTVDADAACAAARPDVVVDFTNAAWTPVLTAAARKRGVRPVIGTTGCRRPKSMCAGAGVRASSRRARGELRHRRGAADAHGEDRVALSTRPRSSSCTTTSVDAPSETSIATARGMLDARGGKP
jgi:hypothetical protein